MKLKYCEQCKEDFDRIDKGYHPHNGDCGHWQCHLFDVLNLIAAVIIMIPLIVIIVPIFLLINSIGYLIRDSDL